jgi:uncharacterized membrane protein YczE
MTIAVSVAVTLWTGLGPGPLDVFIGAVRTHTGLPLSISVWMVVGSLIAIAWALGRRPGFGTLVGPLLVGVVMQATLSFLKNFDTPDALAVRMVIQLLAIGAIGVGAGALIVSGLGAGSGELLTSAASRVSGHPERWVRLGFELSWLAIGVALGAAMFLDQRILALGGNRHAASFDIALQVEAADDTGFPAGDLDQCDRGFAQRREVEAIVVGNPGQNAPLSERSCLVGVEG